MKKVICVVMSFILFVSIATSANAGYYDTVTPGTRFTFGRYEQDGNPDNGPESLNWIVLTVNGNNVLAVTENAIACNNIDTQAYQIESFSGTKLDRWLNRDFLDTAFTAAEANMIFPSDAKRIYSSPARNTSGDKIFLLSDGEVNHYLAKIGNNTCKATKTAVEEGAYIAPENGNCWWWLRSSGTDKFSMMYVGNRGNIDYEGNPINWHNGCVRPAMWTDVTVVNGDYAAITPPPVFNDTTHAVTAKEPSNKYIKCTACEKMIPANSNYCTYCGTRILRNIESTPYPVPEDSYGWSEWTETTIEETPQRSVETRTVPTEYIMVHYGTRNLNEIREFRNYSIKEDYEKYGVSKDYGEKYELKTVTVKTLSEATIYEPGQFIPGAYSGYNKGTVECYVFDNDQYPYFIAVTHESTEYRYRDVK